MNAALSEVACQLLGPPNPRLSTAREMRWGNKGSLSVSIEKDRWQDFETGEGGDVIDLVRREHRCGYREALDFLGMPVGERPTAVQTERPARAVISNPANTERALEIWRAAVRVEGTLAEQYLIGRRLCLNGVASAELRFHPSCPCDGLTWPALIARFRDMRTGEPTAIQRIRLTAAGARAIDHAGKKLAKLTLGSTVGAAIWLTGPWRDTQYVGICEGPETAIALCNAGERSVWALGGSSNIRSMPLLFDRYPCSLVVFADADEAGQGAARVSADRYSAAGRDALIITPARDGADFADIVE